VVATCSPHSVCSATRKSSARSSPDARAIAGQRPTSCGAIARWARTIEP
jgi:hypothetical protein